MSWVGLRQIQKLRKERGLTQEQLADKLHVSLNYIGRIETTRKVPNLRLLYRIAEILEIKVKDLIPFWGILHPTFRSLRCGFYEYQESLTNPWLYAHNTCFARFVRWAFTEMNSIVELFLSLFVTAKHVLDAIVNIPKIVFQNCGMWAPWNIFLLIVFSAILGYNVCGILFLLSSYHSKENAIRQELWDEDWNQSCSYYCGSYYISCSHWRYIFTA